MREIESTNEYRLGLSDASVNRMKSSKCIIALGLSACIALPVQTGFFFKKSNVPLATTTSS